MDDLIKNAELLQEEIHVSSTRLKLDELIVKKEELDKKVSLPGFWDDNIGAQSKLKSQSKLTKQVEPWLNLVKRVNDIIELGESRDESLLNDLEKQLLET